MTAAPIVGIRKGNNMSNLRQMRDNDGSLIKYDWPGGYPIFYLDGQDSALCVDCARESDSADQIEGFRPVYGAVNWEDPSLYCDNCSQRIKSAYAEQEGG